MSVSAFEGHFANADAVTCGPAMHDTATVVCLIPLRQSQSGKQMVLLRASWCMEHTCMLAREDVGLLRNLPSSLCFQPLRFKGTSQLAAMLVWVKSCGMTRNYWSDLFRECQFMLLDSHQRSKATWSQWIGQEMMGTTG